MLVAFVYFTSTRLVHFAPTGRLSQLQPSEMRSFNRNGETIFLSENKLTVFHLLAPNCHCNNLNSDHINSINHLADSLNFNIKQITVEQSDIIPSLPAILVTSKRGKLLYLGPYSQGLSCSKSSSFVETVLTNFKAGYSSELMVDEAKGCYCPLPLAKNIPTTLTT